MSLLTEHTWQIKYDSDAQTLLKDFFEPALSSAVRYDRTTGFFSAPVLALAARGVADLVGNGGHMRLIIGCRLDEPEIEAIRRGEQLRDAVAAQLLASPLVADDREHIDALELLAWMVAKGHLDVKVAVPCGPDHQAVSGTAMFHEKAGIIQDKADNRIAFNGSVNETVAGWTRNWESFHVYQGWSGAADHVAIEVDSFARLWADRAERARVVDIPSAIREDLLRFLPPDGQEPRVIREKGPGYPTEPPSAPEAEEDPPPKEDPRRLVWGIIRHAPALPGGGERIGDATANVDPWPHQVSTFQRLYDKWPPRLLIADEVGLGKTITAGLLLRQVWLSGRARRILVLAPKAVLPQWQIELREKFNLNWPIYDGQHLTWYPSPARRHDYIHGVERSDWHREPCVLTSSQLMRRADRASELLEEAEPYDLVVLDEAHHARRSGAGGASGTTPNQLLRLMRRLRERTQGLVLMTATPMQVDPIEVYDLLDLLGLPDEWTADSFLSFFEAAAEENPSNADFERLAALFRATESQYGPTTAEAITTMVEGGSGLEARKVLSAVRDEAETPRRRLEVPERRAALRVMKANTPVSRLVARHTRDLLRRYHSQGMIDTPIAERDVKDGFVDMSDFETDVYHAVEDYISTTYKRASPGERNAVGFVMTVYRRRMASSFRALARTLERRLGRIEPGQSADSDSVEDASDSEIDDDAMDPEEAARLKQEELRTEERDDISGLLELVRRLPTDTKAGVLVEHIGMLQADGYRQVMVFTQYTDTLDFLRDHLTDEARLSVLCFSGRGGEVQNSDGSWRTVSRDAVKQMFQEGSTEVLLCTEAAGEGLNFQFCGAMINYDMPWNPMKVEQRIGRIDRVGQRFAEIRIVNLHYNATVETDIYLALRERINLFTKFVGKLQPILSRLPRAIREAALADRGDRERERENLLSRLEEDIASAERSPFDLDEVATGGMKQSRQSAPLYDLATLDRVLRLPELLPPGVEALALPPKEYRLLMPGMHEAVRVTADATHYELHPESVELWSPGSPVFPDLENAASAEEVREMGGLLGPVLDDR